MEDRQELRREHHALERQLFPPSLAEPLPLALSATSVARAGDEKELDVAASLHLRTAIEEENKRRARKVVETLQDKTRRMEQEARNLAFIRQELSKLDLTLSRNIDILRSEIETAGREVSHAQAHFDQKEKEYLQARKALLKAKQRKTLLTAHLDFIILTHERGKANKLLELEAQLGISDDAAARPVSHLALPPPRPALPEFAGFAEDADSD